MTNDQPGSFDFDRARGIFTPRDRRFLAGELKDELTDNEKRQKRYRLRKRLLNALQDLHYLGAMRYADTQTVGEKIYEDEDMERRFNSAVHELMNYFYDLYGQEGFIELLEFTLEWQEKTEHYINTNQYIKVDVDIEVTKGDTMSIQELAELSYERPLAPLEKIILSEAGGSSYYRSRHPDLLAPVMAAAEELSSEGGGRMDWDELVDLVVSHTEASEVEAAEAIEDYCLLGGLDTIGPGRVLVFDENYRDHSEKLDEPTAGVAEN